MKRLIPLLFIVLIFSGCSGTWHIKRAEKLSPELFTEKRDSTSKITKKDSLFNIDTNLIISFKDSLFIRELIIWKDSVIDVKNLNSDTIIKKDKGNEAKIWIENSNINATFKMDTLIEHQYKDSILVKDAKIYELKTVNEKQTVVIQDQNKELKWYQKWINIGKYILIGLVSIFVVVLIIKMIKWIK